jgi:hypothetical protein
MEIVQREVYQRLLKILKKGFNRYKNLLSAEYFIITDMLIDNNHHNKNSAI